MAAKAASWEQHGPVTSEQRESSFPPLTPETRLMMRSIPFAHLRGYGSQPDVSGARAKVNTHNPSYKHLRSKSAGGRGERGRVSSVKADYSHVRSRVDTGRRRADTDVAERRRRVTAEAESPALSSQLSSARLRLAQLGRSATLPPMGTSDVASAAEASRNRKVSGAGVGYRRSIKEVKSRVDCSDPHPQVSRQTHSLEELLIVRDSTRESLNPRFIHRTPHPASARSQKFSLPAERLTELQTWERRQARSVKRATIGSIPISSSEATTEDYLPTTTLEAQETISCEGKRAAEGESAPEEGRLALVDSLERQTFSLAGDMDDLVKSKPIDYHQRAEYANREGLFGSSGAHVGCGESNWAPREVGGGEREREREEDLRGSVSSSESVGVTPEYSNMDVDTNAFSETVIPGEDNSCCNELAATERDKIVGFEVSGDSTQTTVNLLHLLGNKNRVTESAWTDYQDSELWVIREEDEGTDSEDYEMEEEICLIEGESGGAPEIDVAVPQLFVVDENNAVVERIKTGRRRSRGSLSSEGQTTPLVSDCTLGLHTLSLHS